MRVGEWLRRIGGSTLLQLGDAAGETALRLLDSAGAVVLAIDSQGKLRPVRGGVTYTGFVYVPKIPAGTNPSYDGDAVDVGTYTFKPSDFGCPDEAKALNVRLSAKWAAAADGNAAYVAPAVDAAWPCATALVRAQHANYWQEGCGVVSVAANGQWKLVVVGANANGVMLNALGYYI
jgi:hypothetical protein